VTSQWLSLVAVACSLPVVLLVSNVLHELGHTAAALAVGYRIRGFVLGGQSSDFDRDGGFLQLGRKFGRATVMITPRRGWIAGWRGVVTYGAGAAVNLLLVLITAPSSLSFVLAHGIRLRPGIHTVISLVTVFFCLVNARAVVWSLVPRTFSSGTISDGKQLANLIRAGWLVEWVKVAESSVDIDRPRPAVWEFLDDPANIPRYDGDVERAFVRPGTPPGVGRVTIVESRPQAPGEPGRAREMEIIAFEPPRRVMSRSVRHHTLRSETLLRTVGVGTTRLTRTVWLGMRPLAPEQRERMRRDLAQLGPRLVWENDTIRRILTPDSTEILSVGARGRRQARRARTR
jgi:hypothetical protein